MEMVTEDLVEEGGVEEGGEASGLVLFDSLLLDKTGWVVPKFAYSWALPRNIQYNLNKHNMALQGVE